MLKILALLAFLSLSGCATIQNHPYATSFAVAIVAGSIAASTQHDNRVSPAHPTMSTIGSPNCAGGACQ
jgi:uncharacterized protein YceK